MNQQNTEIVLTGQEEPESFNLKTIEEVMDFLKEYHDAEEKLKLAASMLKCKIEEVPDKIKQMQDSIEGNTKRISLLNNLPELCCKVIGSKDNKPITCDKEAKHLYIHNDAVCSYCDEHDYVCGEKIK